MDTKAEGMKKQAAAAERKKIMFQPYSAILGRFLSEKTEHTVSMAMPLMLMVKAEFGASLSSSQPQLPVSSFPLL